MINNNAIAITAFYLGLVTRGPVSNAILVLVGYLLRVVSVSIFALTVKVFLVIVDPQLGSKIISSTLTDFGLPPIGANDLVVGVISSLVALVIFQYLLNLWYASAFLKNRTALVADLLKNPLVNNDEFYVHVCLDRIPVGYESTIKSLEICLFYASLLIAISLISPIIAISVVALLILITLLMLVKVHERTCSLKDRAIKPEVDFR